MDRGCERRPRLRCRLIILMTVAGLAMTALAPAARSAPGLSRTPRRLETPSSPCSAPADPVGVACCDEADRASSPEDGRERGADDSESPAEGLVDDDWMATRPSKGRADGPSRAGRGSAWAELPPAPDAGRPARRPAFATGSPDLGLPVRLCRLRF